MSETQQFTPPWAPANTEAVRTAQIPNGGTTILRTQIRVPYPEFDGTQNCVNDPVEWYYLPTRVQVGERAEPTREDRPGVGLSIVNEVCIDCPFLSECREWGLAHEDHGIWGGLGPVDREYVRAVRKQALWSRDEEINAWLLEWRIRSESNMTQEDDEAEAD